MPGVYISYPFCSQKCTFCNFASDVYPEERKSAYLSALREEIQGCDWPWLPETLYFGGGTPSLLPREDLKQLIEAVPQGKLREVTLECAPGSVQSGWGELGINRVSLGVQSFATAELMQTGRRHFATTVEQDVARLRSEGISNINIDLIAGLPGQTRASWKQSLDWIEQLAPPHVSVYIFEVDEDSRLGKESLLGGVRYGAATLPCEELVVEFYEEAVERLARMGIPRYEISNFAAAPWQSAHNLKYWRLEPYLGFGLDAHSFDGRERWSNPDELEPYLGGIRESERTPSQPEEEHFFVGLRLSEGIRPTAQERTRFAEPIARWTAAGLLHQQDDRLRLTDKGILLSNEVLQEFVLAP